MIFFKNPEEINHPFLDLLRILNKIYLMNSDFDWFMITMPIFAIVVFLIVMVGSMEKQPKFLEGTKVNTNVARGLIFLFVVGAFYSFIYMIVWFIDLVRTY